VAFEPRPRRRRDYRESAAVSRRDRGAVAAGDDVELARYLASPALSRFLEATAARRAVGEKWLPTRAGLCWSRSDRAAGAPRFWLRLRFEDRTQVLGRTGRVTAATVVHEVEVELDTTEEPWRLCEVSRASLAPVGVRVSV
jgi:hypothetical protein